MSPLRSDVLFLATDARLLSFIHSYSFVFKLKHPALMFLEMFLLVAAASTDESPNECRCVFLL